MANWMAGAVRHPGALRASAKRQGLIRGDQKLSSSDLGTMARKAKRSGDTRTMKRVTLARTFSRYRGR